MLASVAALGVTSAPSSGDAAPLRALAVPAAFPTGASDARLARPDDARFLTVEPDGRDDVTFMDRLRHALRTVFEAVQKPDAAAEAAERALDAVKERLAAAAESADGFFVQFRIVGVETAYAEGEGEAAYASYRRLGLEIGVARDGRVGAEDAAVVGFDGAAVGLSAAQLRTGLASGTYRQVESAPPAVSGRAADRLADARAGLARVKATQDALTAYRSGDFGPLKELLEGSGSTAGGRSAAVFPGIGAVALN